MKEDLLLPVCQKLYAALASLERFGKGQDLYDNIACIDSFLSEYRNVTFVLQNSLTHTGYISLYENLLVQSKLWMSFISNQNFKLY